MSDLDAPDDAPDELSAAERALEQHLALLRVEQPVPPSAMDSHIIRTARWQRTIRRPLVTMGHLVAAVRDGIRLLIVPADHR